MRYKMTREYLAGDVHYLPGDIIDIDDPVYAAWLMRDSAGALQEIPVAEPDSSAMLRAVEQAPADRMLRKSKGKRADHEDAPGSGLIDRTTFGAVKDK